jgi:integrase
MSILLYDFKELTQCISEVERIESRVNSKKKEERQTPTQLKGFRAAKRKSKTSRKREDMWTPEEHRVFLQYCEDLRLACYHAIAMETGGRPGELLALKISDLKIKTSASTGKKYAEFTIGDKVGGKMKKSRPVSISDAIPYYNTWVSVHPLRDRPKDAYLFPSMQNKAKYRNRPLEENSLRIAFDNIIEKQFPKLLNRPDVSLEDMSALKSIIYDKPHFPYMRRHEFYSEWAPRLPPQAFNQLVGHSKNSRMYEVYLHEFGSEGNRELLIQKGIINRDETISLSQKAIQPKYCPICHEANKQEAKFCFKCNFIISKEGWLEDKEQEAEAQREAEEKKKEFQELKTQQEYNSKQLQMVIDTLGELISKSNALDFKDIKWPLLQVVDYYEDNKGSGVGVSAAKDILKKWREKDRGNTTKNTL